MIIKLVQVIIRLDLYIWKLKY